MNHRALYILSLQILEHKQRVRKHLKAASFSVMYPQMSAEKIRPEYCADCHHPEARQGLHPRRQHPSGKHRARSLEAVCGRNARPPPAVPLQSRALLLGGVARRRPLRANAPFRNAPADQCQCGRRPPARSPGCAPPLPHRLLPTAPAEARHAACGLASRAAQPEGFSPGRGPAPRPRRVSEGC